MAGPQRARIEYGVTRCDDDQAGGLSVGHVICIGHSNEFSVGDIVRVYSEDADPVVREGELEEQVAELRRQLAITVKQYEDSVRYDLKGHDPDSHYEQTISSLQETIRQLTAEPAAPVEEEEEDVPPSPADGLPDGRYDFEVGKPLLFNGKPIEDAAEPAAAAEEEEDDDSPNAVWLRETLDGNPGLREDLSGALKNVLRANYPNEMALLKERERKFDANEEITPEEDVEWQKAKAVLKGEPTAPAEDEGDDGADED